MQDGRLAALKLLYDIYHMQIMEGDVIIPLSTKNWPLPYGRRPRRHEIDAAELITRDLPGHPGDQLHRLSVAEFIGTRTDGVAGGVGGCDV